MKLEKQQSKIFMTEDNTIITVSWRDNKAKKHCSAVSTCGDTSTKTQTNKRGQIIEKPAIIEAYNTAMNGCDRMDQNVAYYGVFKRKTKKWWKRSSFGSLR
ncbi:transposase [Plakobranchus ocellatus]|uniref:Transposase n=1 Tax=Plakobranchus ocellatus TaxID=259542 RepID=A0AAV4CBX0_9GAST|nr:transposase [Plakobranchus ocellatus]